MAVLFTRIFGPAELGDREIDAGPGSAGCSVSVLMNLMSAQPAQVGGPGASAVSTVMSAVTDAGLAQPVDDAQPSPWRPPVRIATLPERSRMSVIGTVSGPGPSSWCISMSCPRPSPAGAERADRMYTGCPYLPPVNWGVGHVARSSRPGLRPYNAKGMLFRLTREHAPLSLVASSLIGLLRVLRASTGGSVMDYAFSSRFKNSSRFCPFMP